MLRTAAQRSRGLRRAGAVGPGPADQLLARAQSSWWNKTNGQGQRAAATQKTNKKKSKTTKPKRAWMSGAGWPRPDVQGWAALEGMCPSSRQPHWLRRKIRKTGKKHEVNKGNSTFKLSCSRSGLTTWNETSDYTGMSWRQETNYTGMNWRQETVLTEEGHNGKGHNSFSAH